jgi:quinol monooxygenase YgiN
MIIVQGHARFAPGTAASHIDAMRTMVETTRIEEGCLLYAFAFDAIDSDVMHITERWTDADALAAHSKSAHMRDFGKAIAAAAPLELTFDRYETQGPMPK